MKADLILVNGTVVTMNPAGEILTPGLLAVKGDSILVVGPASLADEIEASDDFELLAPVPLALVCFRYRPEWMDGRGKDPEKLNEINARLLDELNDTGEIYLTHTKLNGSYAIRFVVGQTNVGKRHVERAWELIKRTARKLFTR